MYKVNYNTWYAHTVYAYNGYRIYMVHIATWLTNNNNGDIPIVKNTYLVIKTSNKLIYNILTKQCQYVENEEDPTVALRHVNFEV